MTEEIAGCIMKGRPEESGTGHRLTKRMETYKDLEDTA